MKSGKSFAILLLSLSLIGSGALAWRQYGELVRLRAELLDGDAASLKKQLAEARKTIKGLQDRIAAMRGRRADDSEEIAGGEARGGPGGLRGGRRAGFAAMASNPEFQKLMAIQMRSRLNQTYGPLFKTLNLSPQQLQQFQGLLAEKQQALMDVLQAARAQGVNPQTDPQGFKQLIAQAQSQVDTQIQQTLGDAGFQQYQQYQQVIPEQNVVNQLTQQLSYSQTPLTPDQASQLVQVLAQTQPQHAGNGTAGTGTAAGGDNGTNIFALISGGGSARVTTDGLNLAAGVLSAPQVEALQDIQQQQQAQAQMRQMMRAAAGGTASGTVTASAGGAAGGSGG